MSERNLSFAASCRAARAYTGPMVSSRSCSAYAANPSWNNRGIDRRRLTFSAICVFKFRQN